MKSGFVALVGRPNAGKSTLLNALLGTKASIVSRHPQTTRFQVRGIANRDGAQIVYVDTPGIHKPRVALGERLNAQAYAALDGVDVTVHVIDATRSLGSGDQFVASKLAGNAIVVLNKIDRVAKPDLLPLIERAADLGADAYIPISARTGDGLDALEREILERLPEGPEYYPPDTVRDLPEAKWVAELVREALLAELEEDLPFSIATEVTEWEWPRVRCEILVERDSQKGIVIGSGGLVLKTVGQKVRAQMEPGAYLELFVKVNRNWQRSNAALDRLGF